MKLWLTDSLESSLKRFKRKQTFPDEYDKMTSRKDYIQTKKKYQEITRLCFSTGTELGKRIFIKYADLSAIQTLLEPKDPRYEDGKIFLNMYYDLSDPRGIAISYFHEFGHQIDHKLGWKFTNDKELLEKLYIDFGNIEIETIADEIKTNPKASSSSDILGALSKDVIVGSYGHHPSYWEKQSNITSEFFAHFMEAQFDSERRRLFEKYFPKSYNYVVDKLKEV